MNRETGLEMGLLGAMGAHHVSAYIRVIFTQLSWNLPKPLPYTPWGRSYFFLTAGKNRANVVVDDKYREKHRATPPM